MTSFSSILQHFLIWLNKIIIINKMDFLGFLFLNRIRLTHRSTFKWYRFVSVQQPLIQDVYLIRIGNIVFCFHRCWRFVCFLFLKSSFRSEQNWEEEADISHKPTPPTRAVSSIINIPYRTCTFVIIDEPTLAQHYHPTSAHNFNLFDPVSFAFCYITYYLFIIVSYRVSSPP